MKRFLFALALLLLSIQAQAATGLSQVLVTNINALDFQVNIDATNAVTNIVKMNLSRSQFQAPVVPGDVWTLTNISGVYGGSTNITTNSIWGIDGSGHITPIVTNNAVIATNIVRAGHGVNTGSETWQTKSIVLTNGVNYLPVSDWSQLQLISPSSDPSLVQIVLSNGWNTVQHLEIFNLTNAVPSQGAFTLTNLTPIPDSLGGGVVKLINNENWVATNGCGIELRFISPDWVEQFRSDVSGNPTFISNTFNNITVISNTTIRGRITINNINVTTNTLWTTNIVGGVTNLQPVDLTLPVLITNRIAFGPGDTNWLHRTGQQLIYEADSAEFLVHATDNLNYTGIHSDNSVGWLTTTAPVLELANQTKTLAFYNDNIQVISTPQIDIGQDYAPWGNLYLTGRILGTNGVKTNYLFSPSVADGVTPYRMDTDVSHTSGNIFELSNNRTNRVVITPLSTLIGSPVTSPNFSVPAALQVSNFQDRGKALTVDIKLGASGNNDDYPVYFYSQITNSSAHPTINMEEVSPSGYIGGAHTLLSVQETPKVTNTVSTWPTYAAASTTAGYFNAAPSGGTNGAAMGLQGSVDPTRNFINIGVGSYVEATTDNLTATNIAFSGTVNQVLGTQKAVGGLFEIGSLANIPAIPSSAGVLIDGHDSGSPLIIAQTNGAVQFKVAANSGYAGGGTTFLSDDGTYKSAGGGGGGTVGTVINTTSALAGNVLVMSSTNPTNTIPTDVLRVTTNKLYVGNGQGSAQFGDPSFSYSPGPITVDSVLTNAQTTNTFSFAGISSTFSFVSATNQLPPGYVTDLSGVWSQLIIPTSDTNHYGDLGEYQGSILNYGQGKFLSMFGVLGRVDNASSASGDEIVGGDFGIQNDSTGIITNAFGARVNFVQSTTQTNFQNAYGIKTIIPSGAYNNNIGLLIGNFPSSTVSAALYQSGFYTNRVEGVVRIGIEEPDFSATDGPSTTISAIVENKPNQINLATFSTNGNGNFITAYISRGSEQSPSDCQDGDIILSIDSIARFGGVWAPGTVNTWFFHTNYTDVAFLNSSGAGQIGVGSGFTGSDVAFASVAPGHGEINSGKPVAIGGSLADLDVGLQKASKGFSSLATDTGAISSTGWTNSLGKDADVAFDATTLVYKLADNAGTWWYTNSVAVGQGFIHLQPGGKFVLVSGSGLTGKYHAH